MYTNIFYTDTYLLLSSRCFLLASIIIDAQAAINLTGALYALVKNIMREITQKATRGYDREGVRE